MEKLTVDEVMFHDACFRCVQCNSKLSLGKFARDQKSGKYLCIPHFKEQFRRAGRYEVEEAMQNTRGVGIAA